MPRWRQRKFSWMKEKMLRILALALAMACLMAFAALAEAPEMAEGADSDWYMDILADESVLAEYPYHAFVDINDNGVPVLIISTTEDSIIGPEDKGQVFLYSEGAPKQVLEVGGTGGDAFYCNFDEHTLTHYSRFSGEDHIVVYHVNGDALEPSIQADAYAQYHAADGKNTDPVYLLDGEAVDEAAFREISDMYALDNAVFYEPMA